jgi:hypothetical protein
MGRSGPHSLYTPAETEWLEPVIQEYIRLVNKNPDDLTISRRYKSTKVEAFLDAFKSELVKLDRKNPVSDIGKWRKVRVFYDEAFIQCS